MMVEVKTKIALIAAVGPDGTIGSGNKMPWHMPRDLRFFRRVTTGHTVIMGRKTFDAIGCKPLPKRKNIIVTRNVLFAAPNCHVAHSLRAALEMVRGEKRVFVIGGGELYRQSIDIADEIYLTEILDHHPNHRLFPLFESDTVFPPIPTEQWERHRAGRQFVASSKMSGKPVGAASGLYMQFVTYRRKQTV
ncbi:MAG: dihydrofolate reductase [Burkholderiaceae bacterium]|nr:dihydrofolate reductase [Burkholderiaceae bacterium]